MTAPTGVLALFFLLMLLFVGGARFVARLVYERPRHGFRARRDARARAHRRRRRRRAPRPARDPAQPVARPHAGRASSTTTRSSGATRIDGVKVLGAHRRAAAHPRRGRARRDHDRDPLGARHAARARRARRPRARASRSARCRRSSSCCRPAQGTVVRQVREVQVEDVLGREPVRMELDRVGAYLSGEVVLVTGAGGSIGSELCRQIARVAPRRLILLDHAEDNLFKIQRELEDDRHVHPSSLDGGARRLQGGRADARGASRARARPSSSTPPPTSTSGLMEANPVEAVRNNALATRLLARVAGEHGVRDVRPRLDRQGGRRRRPSWAPRRRWPSGRSRRPPQRCPATRCCDRAVRQRARLVGLGRADLPPPDRARRAGDGHRRAHDALLHDDPGGGAADHPRRLARRRRRVFVLEMGEPVSIMQLARDMIELSGLRPDEDIAIEVVGRRPGEKLHEELFNPYERPQPTPAEKILQADREPLDRDAVAAVVRRDRAARAGGRRGGAGREGRGPLVAARHPGRARGGTSGARSLP